MARKMKVPKLIKRDLDQPQSGRLSGDKGNITGRCTTCRFWTGGNKCRAFPDGIPEAIIKGKHDHIKPYPGDRGIRYRADTG